MYLLLQYFKVKDSQVNSSSSENIADRFKPKGLDLGAAWACPVLGLDNSVCAASDNQADPALSSLLGVNRFFFLSCMLLPKLMF